MILTCPACATRYVIGDDVFQAGAREVRCVKCSHRWTSDGSDAVDEVDARSESTRPDTTPEAESAVAEPPVPSESAAEQVPDDQVGFGLDDMPGLGSAAHDAAPDDKADDVLDEASALEAPVLEAPVLEAQAEPDAGSFHDAERSKKDRQKSGGSKQMAGKGKGKAPRRRTPAWVWVGWIVLLLCMAGLAAALTFMRQPLTEAWPPLDRLYQTIGDMTGAVSGDAAVHAEKPGVELAIESSELIENGGQRQLNILIRLTNTTAEQQALPIAVVHLVRADGATEKSERIRLPSDQPLAPKESRVMALRLSDVPASVTGATAEAETTGDH
ncbi:MAG: zinc-ribbon domain-containing protein [Minwuia sp.]|nr:zinc-ribbon domain-containing protein [Minwuia sp.]